MLDYSKTVDMLGHGEEHPIELEAEMGAVQATSQGSPGMVRANRSWQR